MLNENLLATQEWIQSQEDSWYFVPPKAGGMAFMRYDMDINSTKLSDYLRNEKSVFILPGDVYGMDKYIRIGIGEEKQTLLDGFKALTEGLKQLKENNE